MMSEDLSFVLESSRLFTFDSGPRRHCKKDLVAKSWNIIAHREPDAAAMVAKPKSASVSSTAETEPASACARSMC